MTILHMKYVCHANNEGMVRHTNNEGMVRHANNEGMVCHTNNEGMVRHANNEVWYAMLKIRAHEILHICVLYHERCINVNKYFFLCVTNVYSLPNLVVCVCRHTAQSFPLITHTFIPQ